MNTFYAPVWMVSWTVFGRRNAILCPSGEIAQQEYNDISTFEGVTNCLVQQFHTLDFHQMVK